MSFIRSFQRIGLAQCGKDNMSRLPRRGALEHLLSFCFIDHYRCQACWQCLKVSPIVRKARYTFLASTLAALWGFSGMGYSQETQNQEQDTTLIAHFMNGNTDDFHSRVYLWNPSEFAGDINAKVYTLPHSGSFSLDSLLLGEVNLGILGAESARMIKLAEDVLTPLGIQTPYLEDGGNLTLEFNVDAPNVQGSAQVFSTNFDFAFGTYPLNAVPANQEVTVNAGDVVNYLTQNVLSQFKIRIEPVGGIPFEFIPNDADWRHEIRKVWDGWDDGHVTVLVGVSGGTTKDWGDYPTDIYFLITDWPDEDSYMVDIVTWGAYQTRISLNDKEVLLMKGWENAGNEAPIESYVVVKVKKSADTIRLTRQEEDRHLEAPIQERADQNAVSSLLSTVEFAQAQEFVSDDPEELKSYGLDQPRATMRVRHQDQDDWRKLELGQQKEESYLARNPDRPSVFTVNQEVFEKVNQDLWAYRDKEVMDVDQDQIARVVIRREEGEEIALRL